MPPDIAAFGSSDQVLSKQLTLVKLSWKSFMLLPLIVVPLSSPQHSDP